MTRYILAIDQGTTSSRAILFDQNYEIVTSGQQEFPQIYPNPGWVEHDPEAIWSSTLNSCQQALTNAKATAQDVVAIGITNQRETTLLWNKETGEPLYNAIVWQDRRTAETCQALKAAGHEALVTSTTGLLLDPYFSATKIAWILNHVDGARSLAEQGKLAFGTVDTFLLWKLSKGRLHATDATNASRTLLYDIHKGQWSDELLALFDIPKSLLPEVKDCSADFGSTDASLFGEEIPICSLIGDQQAATVGQACFQPGMLKSTYGTGCFALLNTGTEAVQSQHRLLTTVAYQLNGQRSYALEGSIFMAGASVQWLRDGLGLIKKLLKRAHSLKRPTPRRKFTWCLLLSGWVRLTGMQSVAAQSTA